MFKVYHVDIHNKTLTHVAATEDAARAYIMKAYTGRFKAGQDHVVIEDEEGRNYGFFSVEWGMTLVAVKKWGPYKSSSAGKPKKPPKPGSKPRKVLDEYWVQLNDNGMLSCQCMGWAIHKGTPEAPVPRTCKHLKDVAAQENLPLVGIGQYFFVDDKKLKAAKLKWSGPSAAEQKLMFLIAAYEKMVNKMAALDPMDMLLMADEVRTAKFKVEAYLDQLENVGPEALAKFDAAQQKLGEALA